MGFEVPGLCGADSGAESCALAHAHVVVVHSLRGVGVGADLCAIAAAGLAGLPGVAGAAAHGHFAFLVGPVSLAAAVT